MEVVMWVVVSVVLRLKALCFTTQQQQQAYGNTAGANSNNANSLSGSTVGIQPVGKSTSASVPASTPVTASPTPRRLVVGPAPPIIFFEAANAAAAASAADDISPPPLPDFSLGVVPPIFGRSDDLTRGGENAASVMLSQRSAETALDGSGVHPTATHHGTSDSLLANNMGADEGEEEDLKVDTFADEHFLSAVRTALKKTTARQSRMITTAVHELLHLSRSRTLASDGQQQKQQQQPQQQNSSSNGGCSSHGGPSSQSLFTPDQLQVWLRSPASSGGAPASGRRRGPMRSGAASQGNNKILLRISLYKSEVITLVNDPLVALFIRYLAGMYDAKTTTWPSLVPTSPLSPRRRS
jgi:hypothetical protein